MHLLFVGLFVLAPAFAAGSFLDSVERERWDLGKESLDVVWVEDDKFPKFTASIYFQDGALNDAVPGLTQFTFDQLTAGTKTEGQRQIAEFFDFYGANLRHSVTHEYSVFTVQALTKDIAPVFGKVCQLFKDAQYPQNELDSYVSRAKGHLRNLVTSHSALADRVFRKVSLSGTPYAEPVEGSLASYDQITRKLLAERLAALNRTKKVLYLAGPRDVKNLRKVLAAECPWSNETKMTTKRLRKPEPQSAIYLVEVPGANQAQIRIGRYLIKDEFSGKYDQYQFMSTFLGGGFTSKLVQELRVKRGLTYSAGAYVSMQRDYGRSGILTFSKNETAADALAIIRDVFADVAAGKFLEKEFVHQKNHQIGAYAFGFEETGAFLGQLMLYDHQGRDLAELVRFPETIGRLTMPELARAALETFPWERQTIVVVGDRELAKGLSRIRPVRIVRYADFL
jgi:zinc protease